jgi:hypothetical protein
VPPAAVTLAIPKGKRIAGVELISPDRPSGERLKFETEGGRVRFTMPSLEVYNVAVLKLEQ